MLSSGAKKDLLVLSFAKSMLEVSKGDDAKSDESLMPRTDNKDYRINKRINNNFDRVIERINETLDNLYLEGGKETAVWVKKNLEKRVGKVLLKIQHDRVNLEMLALWIIYCNFSETKRVLNAKFEWLAQGDQWLRIADMLDETSSGEIQGNMFNTAYDVIARIKG